MIDFMLDNPCMKPFCLASDVKTIHVLSRIFDRRIPRYNTYFTRNAKTPFTSFCSTNSGSNNRIYQYRGGDRRFAGCSLLIPRKFNDNNACIHPDLWSCQTHAVSITHGFKHVIY
ncbi:hypothetical protein ALO50_200144 [Pseudomonas syringae pv. cerasicola]|uniref:Uncharacterized protein n=1 Tax=Pseudomonas syringae pv. cerasicola TaxID=264451 RepID=A0A0P9MPB2_PSESX|nr:hypothetical protein ALO50_200144 [Pseudomonas syringae pv. cerasicola]